MAMIEHELDLRTDGVAHGFNPLSGMRVLSFSRLRGLAGMASMMHIWMALHQFSAVR
jgi:hypothetical protein